MSDATTRDQALRGVFPILATCFHDDGAVDYASQERLIEFCVNGGVHGLVMGANASEGHLLASDEARDLLAFGIERIAGRVPVVATVNAPASRVAAQAAAAAQSAGAAAIMAMPPFFGRWRAGPAEIARHFELLDAAVGIPIIIQDHPLSDIALGVDFVGALAGRLEHVAYVKLEAGNVIHKAAALARCEGISGIFGGNSGAFLPQEVAAGCTGTMPACYMPDVFRRTWDLLAAGDLDGANDFFAPYSCVACFEKDVANRCVWKRLLVERGVIASAAVRDPVPAFATDLVIGQLVDIARRAGLLEPGSRRG